MSEELQFLNKIDILEEELSAASRIPQRTGLLLEVVRESVAFIVNEKTARGRRSVREEVNRVIYSENALGNPRFSDEDRATIINGIDRRLEMALDECEAESEMEQDSWVLASDSSWPPDFMKSLTDRPPQRIDK